MSNAEQGGNQPQRVVLIGGPKHAEFMNLPEGEKGYEYTSTKSLMPYDAKAPAAGWSSWPETATHRYKYDPKLTSIMATAQASPGRVSGCNFFIHESLWGTPFYGGFNLHALSEALKALEKAKDEAKTWERLFDKQQQIVSDRNAKISELQKLHQEAEQRLDSLRTLLEGIAVQTTLAIHMTGKKYNPVWNEPNAT